MSAPGSEAQRRWDAKHAESVLDLTPTAAIAELAHLLPGGGRAIDLASGTGRNGLWLAERGFDVTLADVSPVALDRGRRWAEQRGVAVETLVVDLEAGERPDGLWDLAVLTYFLHLDLVRSLPTLLSPGGVALFAQPTVTNLERFERPSARFCLGVDDLDVVAAGYDDDVEVLHLSQQWTAAGPHEGRLVIRRRPRES